MNAMEDARKRPASPPPQMFLPAQGREIIEHQQLEHQRRAAHDPDDEADDDADGLEVHIAPDLEPLPPRQLRVFRQIFKKRAQKAKRRPVAHRAEGNDQAQRDRADKRHKKQLERLHKANIQRLKYNGELFGKCRHGMYRLSLVWTRRFPRRQLRRGNRCLSYWKSSAVSITSVR